MRAIERGRVVERKSRGTDPGWVGYIRGPSSLEYIHSPAILAGSGPGTNLSGPRKKKPSVGGSSDGRHGRVWRVRRGQSKGRHNWLGLLAGATCVRHLLLRARDEVLPASTQKS